MNIIDLIKEQTKMNDQPTPTERSQIVINFSSPSPTLVMRFSSVKKGEKEYDRLKKAWGKWSSDIQSDHTLHDIDGDMFIATVDLSCTATIAFVDHAKRAKFIPAP